MQKPMNREQLIGCLREKIEDIERELPRSQRSNDYADGKKAAYKNVLEWMGELP
jgi:hypothetical protein